MVSVYAYMTFINPNRYNGVKGIYAQYMIHCQFDYVNIQWGDTGIELDNVLTIRFLS